MNFRLSCIFTAALGAVSANAETLSALALNTPVSLEKIEVTAARERARTTLALVGARSQIELTPGGVEIVDAARYRRGRVSTLSDVFALSAGVVAQPRFGAEEARLSIRGSGLQRTFHGRGVRVLQDGVPINLVDGSFDFQAIEPLSTAYVQVWRGGNALEQGASTLGGAIDFVTRTGRDADTFQARAEAGSFGYLRGQIASGGVTEHADAFAVFTHSSQDGFREHAKQRNQRLFTNVGLSFSDHLETRFYVTGVTTESELPGNLFKAELEADPRRADPVSVTQHRKRDFELLRIASKTTFHARRTEWNAIVAWTYKDLDHPISPVVDQLSNDLLVALKGVYRGELADRAWLLQGGLFFTQGTVNAANYVNVSGQRGAPVSLAETTAVNLETFVETQWEIGGGVNAILGAALADNRRKNERVLGGSASYVRDYDAISPKVGLRWDAAGIQIYGNVSDSYEPPSFSETGALAAPNGAQTARTFELGTRGTWRFARWDVSAYAAKLRGEFLSLNDLSGLPLGTINADRTTHRGLETSGEVDLLGGDWSASDEPQRRLVARAAWTWGQFRFDGDRVYRDNTLAGLSPHLVRGELTWETVDGWYGGPTFEWVPRRAAVDHANTLFADAYAIWGVRVGRRAKRQFAFFVELRNGSDRAYAATTGVIADARGVDQRQFLPGDGRAVYVGVEGRF